MDEVTSSGGVVGFLIEYRAVLLMFHLLGVALGLGGATIADLLFFKFLKDFRVSQKEAEVMRTLSNVIMAALYILLVSGVGLYLTAMETYNNSPGFQLKMIIVAVLSVNGFLMHRRIAPRLINISFRAEQVSAGALRRLRRAAFATGAISFTSWYGSFLIAMLKSLLPEGVALGRLLLLYLAVLAVAVSVSQGVEMYLTRKSRLQAQAPVV